MLRMKSFWVVFFGPTGHRTQANYLIYMPMSKVLPVLKSATPLRALLLAGIWCCDHLIHFLGQSDSPHISPNMWDRPSHLLILNEWDSCHIATLAHLCHSQLHWAEFVTWWGTPLPCSEGRETPMAMAIRGGWDPTLLRKYMLSKADPPQKQQLWHWNLGIEGLVILSLMGGLHGMIAWRDGRYLVTQILTFL